MIDDGQLIGHRQRIKERFNNSNNLSELDLLELILIYGIPRKNTRLIAKNLLRKYDNLLNILTNIEQIEELYVKDNCKTLFKLIHKICVHISKEKIKNQPLIENTLNIIPIFRQMLGGKNIEELYAVFLDINRYIIRYELLSIGTFNCVYTYPREILKQCLNSHAAFIILVHNHPSGSKNPSTADIEFTLSLKSILKPLSINLLDHIIITSSGYLSFVENNIL